MTLTQYIIVAIVALTVAIDVVLAISRGRDATISVAITRWSHQYPIIPFAFGMLMGHFFATYGVCN